IVHGNHDPNGGRYSAIDRWPERVTVFGTREVEHVEIRRGEDLLAVVSGISFPERHVQENLARRYQRTAHPAYHVGVLSDAGIPALIVHGNHDPNGGRYSAIDRWPERVTVFGTREVE
ncbi:hypothetical protein CTI14_52965, partial [Methylobacterium radiotolerans]